MGKEGTGMLIIEIILTVVAWRKGWNAWALLPLVCAMGAGFGIGFYLGATGQAEKANSPMMLLLDGVAIIALIVMCIKERNTFSE